MDFKLILITAEQDIKKETEWINALFENGLLLLHIRKPAYTIGEVKKFLNAIPSDFYSRIILHNHYELLNEYPLKGIHLPEKIRKEKDLRAAKNMVSTSFHTLEDILREKINFEYVFLSPVFSSISKKGYEPSIDLTQVETLLKQNNSPIPFPLIALGGITDKNILQVKNMSFAGAAFIGYIWESTNPVERFMRLQTITGSA